MNLTKTQLLTIVGAVALLITLAFTNPFAYNDATTRTVVTQMNGHQFVQYESGAFYAGFFAKEVTYPNQIGVAYNAVEADYDLVDNTIDIGQVKVQFSDGTVANCTGIAQYILPTDEKVMLEMHNAHRTPEGLVKRRLAPYTQECLSASAQLMTL